jgi:hypothetical protein
VCFVLKEFWEMSSVTVDEVFDKIEDAKLEKQRTNWAAYRDVLIDLAKGNEVDPQEVSIVLDMVACNRQQLTQDVDKMKKRLEARAAVDRRSEILASIEAAEQRHQALVQEHVEVSRRLDPLIKAAHSELGMRRAELDTVAFAESRLTNSCFDPVIEHRQARLQKRQKELHAEIERVTRSLEDHHKRNLANAEKMALAERERAELFSTGRRPSQSGFKEATQSAENYESKIHVLKQAVSDTQQKLDDLKRERDQLAGEWNEIQRQKLIP